MLQKQLVYKKAQMSFFFLLMIGIVLFILAFALAAPLVNNAKNVRSNMDCNNSSISTDQKVTCGVIDITSPMIIGLIFAFGGIAFTAKLLVAGA